MEKSVRGSFIEVAVVVNGGQQRIHRRSHDRQPFVAGVWGASFLLVVRNLTGGRIEVLSSVDGRNVLRDEPGDISGNRGMIVGGHSVWSNGGWRIDDNQIAQFVFTEPGASVAQQATGQALNAGVFGFAVYTEQRRFEQPIYTSSYVADSYSNTNESVAKGLSARVGDMGTGIGDVRHDAVGRTEFVRAGARPAEVLTIQYRSQEWLERYGILTLDEPNAFPGGGTGYSQYLR